MLEFPLQHPKWSWKIVEDFERTKKFFGSFLKVLEEL